MSLLEKVNSPSDLKTLKVNQLSTYSEEVKDYIINVVNTNGGHLASNLGVIDLTIALHYVFNCPTDKFVFDVGHQAYAHKIITGRRDRFATLRKQDGITGFENMFESEYDAFSTGHSSTSLSVGLGLARARDLQNANYNVVCVIGDGALTGGMAYEALNDIGESKEKMIVILNDNEMSISKNVGAISRHLSKLRISARYAKAKMTLKKGVEGIPIFGTALSKVLERGKRFFRTLVLSNKMFEQLGFKYYGVYNGHDIPQLIKMLNQVKNRSDGPVLLHLLTHKGNGYKAAEKDPEKYHGVDSANEKATKKFSAVIAEKLPMLAEKDDKIVAVSAAMLCSTGLKSFNERFPERCFDVGIAEQHAVSMCAGLAASGYKPYFAVYSSFLQRGYDQILHDVCINNLPVRFLIDRAGVIGADGVTHQGLFDISFLSMLPNMVIATPRNGQELAKLLEWSVSVDYPLAIRYPKAYAPEDDYACDEIKLGKWSYVRRTDSSVYLLAAGNRMINIAKGIDGVNIVNARFVKPLDCELLNEIDKRGNLLITLEDNVLKGGFGESVKAYLPKGGRSKVECIGFADRFSTDLSVSNSLENNGITSKNIVELIKKHSEI